MKKLIFLIVTLLVLMFTLTACGSEYSDNSTDNEYNEDENTVAEKEMHGVYTEPLTGAVITYSDTLKYKTETTGQYGKGVRLTDKESYPSAQLYIKIDEIYADRIDKAYEKLGFSRAMSGSKLMAYTENYFMVFTETEFFDKTSYEYDWVCLLTDGSVLHLTLSTKQNNPVMLVRGICIDFTGAEGKIGLSSIYDLPQYEGNSPVAGIWENTENGYWFDCSGGLLFSIYDEEGDMIDCGTYDRVFKRLSGHDQSYSVYAEDDGLSITQFDGVFQSKQTLEVIPGDIPGGIPCEGTQAGEASGELSEHRGKWENDTISCRLEINRGGINIYKENSYSNDSYTVTDKGELELSDGTLVRVQDSGGMTLDGYDGVFYREGEKESVYAPYLGQWYNDVIGQKIWLQNGGVYCYEIGGSGFGGSVWSVTGKGTANIGGDSAYLNENGNIVIDGYDGVFVLQAQ